MAIMPADIYEIANNTLPISYRYTLSSMNRSYFFFHHYYVPTYCKQHPMRTTEVRWQCRSDGECFVCLFVCPFVNKHGYSLHYADLNYCERSCHLNRLPLTLKKKQLDLSLFYKCHIDLDVMKSSGVSHSGVSSTYENQNLP